MVSPTSAAPWSDAGLTVAVLEMLTVGAAGAVWTVAVDGALGALASPRVSVPVAVAESLIEPVSTSGWVTV